MRHNGKTLATHVDRDNYGHESGQAFNPDAIRFAAPKGEEPYRAFVLAIVLQAVEDIAAWVNRRREPPNGESRSKSGRWEREHYVERLRATAFMADQWLHGYDGCEVENRVSFTECCKLIGFDEDDFRNRIYQQWPSKQLTGIRNEHAIEAVCRWRLGEKPHRPEKQQRRCNHTNYDWSLLFNGDEHVLEYGVDFFCSPRSMRENVVQTARRLRCGVRIHRDQGTVTIQRVCGNPPPKFTVLTLFTNENN